MTEGNDQTTQDQNEIAEAVVKTGFNISFIWIVPIVALLVGLGLAAKALHEKGPVVTITFESAEGLQAGKTKIRHKDVEIGTVKNISLDKKLEKVIIEAELDRSFKSYLTEKTRFWVVRARIGSGQVSGLSTLLSGAYIAIDPVREGRKNHSFIGLETPPIVTSDLPGKHFMLKSRTLGSLNVGSPIYYRQIKVGEIVSYKLADDGKYVEVQIFIHAPYDRFVLDSARFWNASGIDMSLSTEGIEIDTQSLASIISGGVAFRNFESTASDAEATVNKEFKLYENRQSAFEREYTVEKHYLLYFDDSVRGLNPGAPVEMRGTRIGEVVSVDLQFNVKRKSFEVPVVVAMEPERIKVVKGTLPEGVNYLAEFVRRGLRAQLETGNLLTGQLYVKLDFFENVDDAEVITDGKYQVLPTIPRSSEQILKSLTETLKKLEKVPFEKIGTDLADTLAEIKKLTRSVNEDISPSAKKALVQLRKTLAEIESLIGKNSDVRINTSRTLDELAAASRSLRMLMESLEKKPESIVFGKDREE